MIKFKNILTEINDSDLYYDFKLISNVNDNAMYEFNTNYNLEYEVLIAKGELPINIFKYGFTKYSDDIIELLEDELDNICEVSFTFDTFDKVDHGKTSNTGDSIVILNTIYKIMLDYWKNNPDTFGFFIDPAVDIMDARRSNTKSRRFKVFDKLLRRYFKNWKFLYTTSNNILIISPENIYKFENL